MFSCSKSSELAPTRWTAASYAYAAVVAAGLGYFLLGVPIQLTDSFGNMLQLRDGTLGDLVYNQFYQRGYLRPFLWGHLRIVYDLSGGNYYAWFRGWHVAQLVLLFVLFLRLLRPRTATDFVAVAIGLAALVGIHTFAGSVREAFPINTFMTILLCCFGAADLALGERRWWRDVLACALFVFAALTVESGLLIAVVFVGAFLVGARGVSRVGIAAVMLLFVGYFWLRFSYLEVGVPGLIERSSGFGFGPLEPDELTARFGGNPLPFYAYNVIASVASVLFAEPRGGVFDLTRGILNDTVRVSAVVNALASTLATLLILAFAWQRRRVWLHRRFEHADRLVAVFWVILLANAAIGYAYTKDVIMSPAGAFYAVALAVACGHWLRAERPAAVASTLVAVVLVATSSLWAWRMVGIHVGLRNSAVTMRNEWAYADQWFNREQNAPTAPRDVALKQQLQLDAISTSQPDPGGRVAPVVRGMTLMKLTALPAMVATCGILGFVIAEAGGLAPLTYGSPRNIAEAAGLGSAADVWRLVDAGETVTQVYPVRREIISPAVPYATALEAAVWSRRVQLVVFLHERGLLPAAERDRLTCLARELRIADIEEYLAHGRTVACADSVVGEVTARTSAGGGP